MRWLTAIPVYNESAHLHSVLAEVRKYSPEILVVNDGSTDGTAGLLDRERGLDRIDHPSNRGYGAAVTSAFAFVIERSYDLLVTMDCDGQHEPARVPVLLEAIHDADIVSGSRSRAAATCATSARTPPRPATAGGSTSSSPPRSTPATD
jgi:dolichol-phosphate mannosyltransferase